MAAQNQIVNLSGKKYQLVPINKGTKVPAGTESITWHDGNDYFLIPVESTPAKAPDAPKAEAKAEAKVETKAETKGDVKSGFPWGSLLAFLAALLLVLGIIWAVKNLSARNTSNASNASNVSSVATTPVAINKDHNTWSAYGVPSFIVTDGSNTESASDVFTDPTKGNLTLTVKPTEEVCLLQYGITKIFTDEFSANFAANDTGAGFRVISKSYWDTLPASDGAYNLCWDRK